MIPTRHWFPVSKDYSVEFAFNGSNVKSYFHINSPIPDYRISWTYWRKNLPEQINSICLYLDDKLYSYEFFFYDYADKRNDLSRTIVLDLVTYELKEF